jgi:hypothetical protein
MKRNNVMKYLKNPHIITVLVCFILSIFLFISFAIYEGVGPSTDDFSAVLVGGIIFIFILLFIPGYIIMLLIVKHKKVKVFFHTYPFVFTLFALIAFFFLPFTIKILGDFIFNEFEYNDPELNIFIGLGIYWFCISLLLMGLCLYYQLTIYKQTVSEVILEKRGKTMHDIKFIIATYFNVICIYSLVYLIVQLQTHNKAFSSLDIVLDTNATTFESMLNCLYFSFTTISSLGYDVFPEEWYAKVIVVSQFILGMLLMVFSLGIILGKEDEVKASSKEQYKNILKRNRRRKNAAGR